MEDIKIIIDKIQNVADLTLGSLQNAAKGKPVIVPPDIRENRLTICRGCDKFMPLTSQCSECGCYMNYKTQICAAECPIKKWDKYIPPD